MKIKILLTLLAISLQVNLNAQVAHDYKQGCCKLVGAINNIESCYCAGCADTAKKNKEAKAQEDKRIKDLSIKKAEEERQKAIARQKKENEAIAQKNKEAKANTLHYGFASYDKKVNKPEVEKKTITSKERLQLKANKREDKYGFDDANGTPIIYKDEFTSTKSFDSGSKYPLGFGVVQIGKIADIINYKGERILKDEKINAVYHIYDDWFIAFSDFLEINKNSYYRGTAYKYSSSYLINIISLEKITLIPNGELVAHATEGKESLFWMTSFHGHVNNYPFIEKKTVNPILQKNTQDSRRDSDLAYLILSDLIGCEINNWYSLIRVIKDDEHIFYYMDKNKKIRIVKNISNEKVKATLDKFKDLYGRWISLR